MSARIGLRAGLIFAPLCGAIGFIATLDLAATALATAGGGLAAGLFFGLAAYMGARNAGDAER